LKAAAALMHGQPAGVSCEQLFPFDNPDVQFPRSRPRNEPSLRRLLCYILYYPVQSDRRVFWLNILHKRATLTIEPTTMYRSCGHPFSLD